MLYKNKFGVWSYTSSTMEGGMMPNRERYMANRGWSLDLMNFSNIAEYNARMFDEWIVIQRKRKRKRAGVIITMPEEVAQWAEVNKDYIRQHYNP